MHVKVALNGYLFVEEFNLVIVKMEYQCKTILEINKVFPFDPYQVPQAAI